MDMRCNQYMREDWDVDQWKVLLTEPKEEGRGTAAWVTVL